MGKTVERAVEAVLQSEFDFRSESNTFEVRNAVIFWTNFRGEENKFGSTARTFNLAVNKEVGEALTARGWRVRDIPRENGDTLYFVNIKVNMDSAYPPLLTLYTEYRGKRSRRVLDKDSVGDLDRIDIQSADCTINEYMSKMHPGKVTGYLKKINIIQEKDVEFGGKYDDWMQDESDEEEIDPYTIEEQL